MVNHGKFIFSQIAFNSTKMTPESAWEKITRKFEFSHSEGIKSSLSLELIISDLSASDLRMEVEI